MAPCCDMGDDLGDPFGVPRNRCFTGRARGDGAQRDAFFGAFQQKVLLIDHFPGAPSRHREGSVGVDDGALARSNATPRPPFGVPTPWESAYPPTKVKRCTSR